MVNRSSATVTVQIDPAAVQRAQRLFTFLTGVPMSPDRKEAMVRAAILDGTRVNGRPAPVDWKGAR